jgi:phage recombination protein Bet
MPIRFTSIVDNNSRTIRRKGGKMKEEVATVAKTKTAAVAIPQGAGTSVLARMAARFGVEPAKMMECLKATAFKGPASNEQIMALCIVADQFGLNPWTKEIYAFPDKNNGIVPVVGVDGWARIINDHPAFDGMEIEGDDVECRCTIYRKDRSHPIAVTEFMEECKRETGPWKTHPMRMLRHKAMIQCARLAFGFAGIKDLDEAERIVEAVEISPPPYEMPKPKAEAIQTEAANDGEQLEMN